MTGGISNYEVDSRLRGNDKNPARSTLLRTGIDYLVEIAAVAFGSLQ